MEKEIFVREEIEFLKNFANKEDKRSQKIIAVFKEYLSQQKEIQDWMNLYEQMKCSRNAHKTRLALVEEELSKIKAWMKQGGRIA